MRDCPVCDSVNRDDVFSMGYLIPDGWTLPDKITWYECLDCGMIYGDGKFNQQMLNQYYQERYGYGIYHADNNARLINDAVNLSVAPKSSRIVDFGGAGDDGKSLFADKLKSLGFTDVHCVGAGEALPQCCDVIYASHVIEHIYDLPGTVDKIEFALKPEGLLIIDVPDSTGLLERWRMPILDFNTKHLNHFTVRTILQLGYEWGFEAVYVKPYELEFAPCVQVHFRRLNVTHESKKHIQKNINARLDKLRSINSPVNVWGMSDIVWHLLSQIDLQVLNYIDNDPAYRGATYKGKPVLERPDNDAPIVIMAQGQRGRLIENIRKAGVVNEIIEI